MLNPTALDKFRGAFRIVPINHSNYKIQRKITLFFLVFWRDIVDTSHDYETIIRFKTIDSAKAFIREEIKRAIDQETINDKEVIYYP